MKTRRLVWSMFLFLFVMTSVLLAEEKIYIDITGANFRRIPVAVPPFLPVNGNVTPLSRQLQQELVRALSYTDLFDIIDEKAYLVNPYEEGVKAKDIHFDKWSAIGADLLIKGSYETEGDRIVVEIRTYDTYQGKFIFGRRYKLKKNLVRKAAYKFVNELLGAITGKRGVFGSKIAFQYRDPGSMRKDIYVVDMDGSNLKRITFYNRIAMFPDWSPDGKFLLFSAFVRSYPDLFIANLLNGNVVTLVRSNYQDIGGRFSPDGKYVAFSSTRSGNSEIYRVDRNGKNLVRLTYSPYIDVSPAWSPDGKQIVFVSNRAGNPHLYIMDSEGGNIRRLTTTGKYNATPDWSPDGQYIAFSKSLDGRRFDIYIIKPDGTDERVVTDGVGSNEYPRWSPDSRYIVFTSNRDGRYQLYIVNVSSGKIWKVVNLPGDAKEPAWSRTVY